MDMEDDILAKLPPGYRFKPIEEELITHYLIKKMSYELLPSQVIPEIDDTHLHSKSSSNLVRFSCGEREWYFFVRGGVDLVEEQKQSKHGFIRIVGDGNGFWKANGEETDFGKQMGKNSLFATLVGKFLPSKSVSLIFQDAFEEMPGKHIERWTNIDCPINVTMQGEEWVLGKLISGEEYTSYF